MTFQIASVLVLSGCLASIYATSDRPNVTKLSDIRKLNNRQFSYSSPVLFSGGSPSPAAGPLTAVSSSSQYGTTNTGNAIGQFTFSPSPSNGFVSVVNGQPQSYVSVSGASNAALTSQSQPGYQFSSFTFGSSPTGQVNVGGSSGLSSSQFTSGSYSAPLSGQTSLVSNLYGSGSGAGQFSVSSQPQPQLQPFVAINTGAGATGYSSSGSQSAQLQTAAAPLCAQQSYNISVPDNAAVGVTILRVIAVDEQNSPLRYEITDPVFGAVTINAQTGEITPARSLVNFARALEFTVQVANTQNQYCTSDVRLNFIQTAAPLVATGGTSYGQAAAPLIAATPAPTPNFIPPPSAITYDSFVSSFSQPAVALAATQAPFQSAANGSQSQSASLTGNVVQMSSYGQAVAPLVATTPRPAAPLSGVQAASYGQTSGQLTSSNVNYNFPAAPLIATPTPAPLVATVVSYNQPAAPLVAATTPMTISYGQPASQLTSGQIYTQPIAATPTQSVSYGQTSSNQLIGGQTSSQLTGGQTLSYGQPTIPLAATPTQSISYGQTSSSQLTGAQTSSQLTGGQALTFGQPAAVLNSQTASVSYSQPLGQITSSQTASYSQPAAPLSASQTISYGQGSTGTISTQLTPAPVPGFAIGSGPLNSVLTAPSGVSGSGSSSFGQSSSSFSGSSFSGSAAPASVSVSFPSSSGILSSGSQTVSFNTGLSGQSSSSSASWPTSAITFPAVSGASGTGGLSGSSTSTQGVFTCSLSPSGQLVRIDSGSAPRPLSANFGTFSSAQASDSVPSNPSVASFSASSSASTINWSFFVGSYNGSATNVGTVNTFGDGSDFTLTGNRFFVINPTTGDISLTSGYCPSSTPAQETLTVSANSATLGAIHGNVSVVIFVPQSFIESCRVGFTPSASNFAPTAAPAALNSPVVFRSEDAVAFIGDSSFTVRQCDPSTSFGMPATAAAFRIRLPPTTDLNQLRITLSNSLFRPALPVVCDDVITCNVSVVFAQPVDISFQGTYLLTVNLTGGGIPPSANRIRIAVQCSDLAADSAPALPPRRGIIDPSSIVPELPPCGTPSMSIDVSEDVPVGTTIINLPSNSNPGFRYQIADASAFGYFDLVDPVALTVSSPLFEPNMDSVFLRVLGLIGNRTSCGIDVYIGVKNVNRNRPRFDQPSYNFVIDCALPMDFVGTVSASDIDSGRNNIRRFFLSPEDTAVASVEPASGRIRLRRPINDTAFFSVQVENPNSGLRDSATVQVNCIGTNAVVSGRSGNRLFSTTSTTTPRPKSAAELPRKPVASSNRPTSFPLTAIVNRAVTGRTNATSSPATTTARTSTTSRSSTRR